jgi:DNA-binding transcriptional LysR family regulator
MPPVVPAFRERHPDVDLHVEDVAIATLVERLRAGQLDAA